MGEDSAPATQQTPRTEHVERDCLHCRERHEVEVVTEPGWEQIVYCPRTGEAG